MKVPVTISYDVSFLALPPFISVHKAMPPPPTPPIVPHVEPPVPMFWPPGIANGQNKWTTNVKAQGCRVTLQGHNVGIAIPHIAIGPSQLGVILVMAKSARTVNFSASTVRMNGTPAAAIDVGKPPMPMSICSEIFALPSGFATNFLNPTVFVGVTLADYIAGCVSIAIGLAAAAFGDSKYSDTAKAAAAVAAGFAAGVAQVAATGQGTVGITVGTPPNSVSIGVGVQDGKWTNVGVSSGNAGVQYNRDGSWQGSSGTDPSDPSGQRTWKT